VSITKTAEFTDGGVVYANRNIWNITGRLEGDDFTDMTSKINALEAAYNKSNQSPMRLEFVENGSVTPTAHEININDTLDGIRVTAAPHYPVGSGAEYVNFRNYAITVTALVKTKQNDSDLVFFQEEVETVGARPRDVVIETLNTFPVMQRTANQTAYMVSQRGRAIGLNNYPPAPPYKHPIGVAAIMTNRVSRKSPRETYVNGRWLRTMYEIGWHYVMALTHERASLPNTRSLYK
jgi:hypothetical protein